MYHLREKRKLENLQDDDAQGPSLSSYERRRKTLKADKVVCDDYKRKDVLYQKVYRDSMTESKKKEYNEKTKGKMQKYREKLEKEGHLLKETGTRQQTERTDYWRKKKQEQRKKMTLQQRDESNRKRREQYHSAKKRLDRKSPPSKTRMPRKRKGHVPSSQGKCPFCRPPVASDLFENLQEEKTDSFQPFIEIVNDCDVAPAYEEIVCKVEPADEEIDYRVELAHEEKDIKVEPIDEIDIKVEPAFEEIDIIKVEPADEELDYRIELADEEIDIKIEPDDEQSMQTDVTTVTPHRKSTETADASVQTIESDNDHNYAKNLSDKTSNVSSRESDISQSQTRKIYVYFVSTEVNEETVDHPVDIGEVEVEVESLSLKKFSSVIKENLNGKYSVYETDSGLTLIDFYNMDAAPPAVKLTVKFDSGFECHVSVHGKEIPRSHDLWTDAPEFFHDVESALILLERLDSYTVCCGNPELEFHELVPIGSDLTNTLDTDFIAPREGDFGAFTANGKSYSSTIRSRSCELLTKSKTYTQNCCKIKKEKCKQCKHYEFKLRRKKTCLEKRKENPRKFISSCFTHRDLTREELCSKLNEQKEEITNLKQKIRKLKREVAKSSQTDGVNIKKHEIGKLKREVGKSSEKDDLNIKEHEIGKLKREVGKSGRKDGLKIRENKIGKLKREVSRSSRKDGVILVN